MKSVKDRFKYFLPGEGVVVGGLGGSVFAFPNEDMPNALIFTTLNNIIIDIIAISFRYHIF